MGLPEIKKQLEAIVEKIIDAEKDAADGLRVVPPKPFHMVFIGSNGTGTAPNPSFSIVVLLFYVCAILVFQLRLLIIPANFASNVLGDMS